MRLYHCFIWMVVDEQAWVEALFLTTRLLAKIFRLIRVFCSLVARLWEW